MFGPLVMLWIIRQIDGGLVVQPQTHRPITALIKLREKVLPLGLRVVSLQHDGIAVMGLDKERHEEVARTMGEAVTAACGYGSTVTVKEVTYSDVVD